jgi:hypothetical protein
LDEAHIMTDQNKADRDRSTLVKQNLVVIALLIVLVIGVLWTTFGESSKWEYTIESPTDAKLQERLSQLGAAGWELVFARRTSSDAGGSSSSAQYEMIFKRHKPSIPFK